MDLKNENMNSTYRQKLFSSKKRYTKANPEKQKSNLKLEILIAPKYKDVLKKILKNKKTMTSFIKIQPHIEVKVPDYFPEEREVDVKVIFRASEDGNIYFGPLECYGSIHKNKTMLQLQQEFRKNYENQGYKFVEITQVLIDEEFLKEYKADAKTANKEESERCMNLIHSLLGDSRNKQ